jgi:adenosylcobinamide-GDP ribazoletransferase
MAGSRLRQVGASFGFLSVVPIRLALGPWSVVGFALVGLVVGGADAAAFTIGGLSGSALVAAFVALVVDALLTRGFHYDALADTADALGVVATRERRLEIMRDPRAGAFGVLALVLVVGLRAATLAATSSLIVIVSAVVLGRLVMAVALVWLPPASTSSLVMLFAPGAHRGLLSVLLAVEVVLVAALDVAALGPMAALALAGGILVGVALLGLGTARLGGVTGDLVGASGLCAETAVLVAAALVRLHGL